MPYYVNVLICIFCVILLIGEILFIILRNRRIVVKGKDDFFIPVLILLALMLVSPLDNSSSLISALRTTLAIMVIFVSFAVRRGVSERGVEKIVFTIPWAKLTAVNINPCQSTTVTAVFITSTRHTYRLIFHYVRLRPLLRELQKHLNRNQILLEKSVEQALQKYPTT